VLCGHIHPTAVPPLTGGARYFPHLLIPASTTTLAAALARAGRWLVSYHYLRPSEKVICPTELEEQPGQVAAWARG